MFIGRKAEINFLNERYQSPNAELIVLYGGYFYVQFMLRGSTSNII